MNYRKIKNCLIIFSTIILAATPFSIYSNEDKHEFILTSEAGDRDSALGKSMREWARLIEEKSGGRMHVKVFYQGELGGQQELFDQLARGNVDMMLTWPQTSYDKRMGINYLPYLVLNWDDAKTAYAKDGWLTQIINPIYADIGMKYFGPYPEGFGGIATRGRYATNFDDASGLKVRSQPIFPLPQTIKAMGLQAVPIDWAEVYTSIQTGVVDGDSSNVIYWDYEYFRDVLDYYVHSKHNFSSYALLMNNDNYEALNDEDKAIVDAASQEVIDTQFNNAKAEDDKWIAAAQEAGMEYIVPSETEMADWIKRVREQVWPLAEESLGAETMEKLRSNASVVE